MTCSTCHKEITPNSFYEFKKYFCSKACRDKHRAEKGFDTVFDEMGV